MGRRVAGREGTCWEKQGRGADSELEGSGSRRAAREPGRQAGGVGLGEGRTRRGPRPWGLPRRSAVRCHCAGRASVSHAFCSATLDRRQLQPIPRHQAHLNTPLRPETRSPLVQNSFTVKLKKKKKKGLRSMEKNLLFQEKIWIGKETTGRLESSYNNQPEEAMATVLRDDGSVRW